MSPLDRLKNRLDSFSFLDSLSLKKKTALLTSCERTIQEIAKSTLTPSAIAARTSMVHLAIKRLQGSFLARLIHFLFYRNQNYDYRYRSLCLTAQKAEMLKEAPLPVRTLLLTTPETGSELLQQDVESQILLHEHIYDRMRFFNHPVMVSEGKILFLCEAELYSYDQLQELGVIDSEGKISPEFSYQSEGFVRKSETEWDTLTPTYITDNPPKEYTLEIVVDSKTPTPGVFSSHGHASLVLTAPTGEVYSVGFYPDAPMALGETIPGVLRSPDPLLFGRAERFTRQKIRYTLENKEAFESLLRSIEEVKRRKPRFQSTSYNCSCFARDIRDLAIAQGAKAMRTRHFSYPSSVRVKFQETILLIFDSLQQPLLPSKAAQHYFYLSKVHLPVDLLFE